MAGNVQFTSYGVKSRAGECVDKVSELVVFIDNLVYDQSFDEGKSKLATELEPTQKPIENAKVLLTALALNHASSADIWYGMIESPSHLVTFFTKYFRMSMVGNLRESSDIPDDTRIPLVCDLKKCSFRYAILLLEQHLKTSQTAVTTPANVDVQNERMIVQLPDTLSAANAVPQMSVISQREGLGDGVGKLNTLISGICFDVASSTNSHMIAAYSQICTNSTEESRPKKIHVRLVRKPSNKSESTHDCLVEVLSVSRVGKGELATPVDPSKIHISADWNVLRSFSIQDKRRNKSEPDEVINCFVTELKKKQAELHKLECFLENSARQLLTKVYEDRLAFEIREQTIKKDYNKKILQDYEAVLRRRREADLAWQAQLEQDMDAVCDVCFDGEVTPDNQIIFCDSCNVAIHQRCYGIDRVPSGNFFCHPCTYFEIDKEFLAAQRRDDPRTQPTRLPIVCELCPRRQGAFVQVQSEQPTRKPKWVHVACAKWFGIQYIDIELRDKVEDVSLLKSHFKNLDVRCCLCESNIGAMHQCREDGCEKYLHVTCARLVGTCSVQHGEDSEGFLDAESLKNQPWTLACPEHSEVNPESVRDGSITVDQLVAIAKSYPPEPLPQKPFNKMTGKERKEYWSDRDNLADFFDKVMPSLTGAKCAVCEGPADTSVDSRCSKCGIFFHAGCVDSFENLERNKGMCSACRFTEECEGSDDYEAPHCHMCNQSGGPLVRTFAKPVSMKKWKTNTSHWRRSLFGINKFCHVLCGM